MPNLQKVYDPEVGDYVWEDLDAQPSAAVAATAPTVATTPATSQMFMPARPRTVSDLLAPGSLSANDPLAAVARRQAQAPTAEELKTAGADLSMSALPYIGAAGLTAITAASGPFSPAVGAILLPLAAYLGGATGKHAETGLRAVTGIGAENLPATPGSRLFEMHTAGKEQAMLEMGGMTALKAAEKAALWTTALSGNPASPGVAWAHGTELGKAIVGEKKVAEAYKARIAATQAERAAANEGAESAMKMTESRTAAAQLRADEARAEALVLKKSNEVKLAEEMARNGQIEEAHAGVERIFSNEGVLQPGAGMTDLAFNDLAKKTVKAFGDDLLDNMHGEFSAIESAIRSRGGGKPVDVRPLFKRTVDRIKQEFRLTGTGQQFTKLNPVLADLTKDFEQYSKGQARVVAPPSPIETATGLVNPERSILKEAVEALDKDQSVGGLLVMQSGLQQEIMKLKAAGDTKAAKILEGLLDDTQRVVRRELVAVNGWDDLAKAHEVARRTWGDGKAFMEQQVYKTMRDNPDKLPQLLTARGGYLPVVKRVLSETGEYQTLWPEIRRRWLEANMTKNGTFDPASAVRAFKENSPVLGQIFDTPESKQTLARIQQGLQKIDDLQLKALRSVADYKRAEQLKKTLDEIEKDLQKIEAARQAEVEAASAAGGRQQFGYEQRAVKAGEKLYGLKGEAEEALKAAAERRAIAEGKKFSSIPQMLMSRGGAGMVMGAGGALVSGGNILQRIGGAAAGFGAGYTLNVGRSALVKRIIDVAEREPAAYDRFLKVLDSSHPAAKVYYGAQNLTQPNVIRSILIGNEGRKTIKRLQQGDYQQNQ